MLQLRLRLHDSEVSERIPNNGMNSEAARFEAGVRLFSFRSQKDGRPEYGIFTYR